jgi:ribosomal protein S17E
LKLKFEFGQKMDERIMNGLVQGIRSEQDRYSFTKYMLIDVKKRLLTRKSSSTIERNSNTVKFTFFLKKALIDGFDACVIQSLEVKLYNWYPKSYSTVSVKNAMLIQKLIRIISITKTHISQELLSNILVNNFNSSMVPFGYKIPALIPENSKVSNIYFDEYLVAVLIANTLSLNAYKFSFVKNSLSQEYVKYPGHVEGFAKKLDNQSNHSQICQLDLNLMPFEKLKVSLITSGYTKDNLIKRMSNVDTIDYYLRKNISGIGFCDLKLEIFLTSYEFSASKPAASAGDIDINLANKEVFYNIISSRIVNLLKLELAKQGKLVEISAYENMRANSSTSLMESGKFGKIKKMLNNPVRQARKGEIKNIVESAMQKKLVSSNDAKPRVRRGKGFVSRLFKEHEIIFFLIHIYPSTRRFNKYKLLISSADVLTFFKLPEFFKQAFGSFELNMNTILQITRLDSKTIFNSLCNYICNKIVMRRDTIYKKPFFEFSKDISEMVYSHQNDFLIVQSKTVPKMGSFLRVQALDHDLVYHRALLFKRNYFIASVVRMKKSQKFQLKLYSPKSCRSYSTYFDAEFIMQKGLKFISETFHYLVSTSVSNLASTLDEIMESVTRKPDWLTRSEVLIDPIPPEKLLAMPDLFSIPAYLEQRGERAAEVEADEASEDSSEANEVQLPERRDRRTKSTGGSKTNKRKEMLMKGPCSGLSRCMTFGTRSTDSSTSRSIGTLTVPTRYSK